MYRERHFYYRMNFLPKENTSFLSYSRYFIPPQYWHRFCISIVTRIGAFYFSKCLFRPSHHVSWCLTLVASISFFIFSLRLTLVPSMSNGRDQEPSQKGSR